MRTALVFTLSSIVAVGVALGGCNGSASDGISTASLLDGKSGAGSGETVSVKPDDVTAKAVQVAWTTARAQKCGFNFDAPKLKANYLASEARAGAQQAQLVTFEKAYDQTLANVTANIKGEPGYCSDRKSAAIKADLQRHLAGDFTANLPQEKKVASGFWDGLVSDAPPEAFDQKNFWNDLEAKRQGAKNGQRAE